MGQVVADAAELLGLGELVDVRILEFSATLAEDDRSDLDDEDVEHTLQVKISVRSGVLEAHLKADVRTKTADYSGVAATQFHFSSDIELSQEVAREFTERVAVMALYPYVRELVSDMSVKLRQAPVTLPLMRSGQTQMEAHPEQTGDFHQD